MTLRFALLFGIALAMSGCDQLGIESATQVAAKREADGRAVGGACRHAGRAIEDCYTLNRRADRAAVYAGWREMDDYMRENKLQPVAALLTPGGAGAADGDRAEEAEGAHSTSKAAPKAAKADKQDKSGDKAAEKTSARTAEREAKHDS